MTKPTALPEKLWPIRDAIIDLVHAGEEPPEETSKIYRWLEDDGWDELVSDDEMVVGLQALCADDDELRAVLDLDDSAEVTDQMRISYTRELLEKACACEHGDPSTVVCYTLKKGDEKSVVICGTMSVQQGGWDVVWDGVFLTKDEFYELLRLNGVYLLDDADEIDDAAILSFWNRTSHSDD
jgi:hypothetical protein